jgi:hypothetical protein
LHSNFSYWQIKISKKPNFFSKKISEFDIWENLETEELHIVDYKSTSKQGEPTIESGFGESYKWQMEIYQWLFRKAGFKVSNTGYFLYVNGSKAGGFYDANLAATMRFTTSG